MSVIVLMAGGTGGHLFPAMALAQELRRRGHVIHLMTDERVAGYGDDFPASQTHIVPSATPSIRNPLKLIVAFAKLGWAAEKFGRVDILVNTAGIQHVAKIEDFPIEKWDAIIAINLSSAFLTSRLALPAMKAANDGKGWGRIINIASAHGLVGSPEKSAYVAAKHGLVGLTKVTALETATTGVTCNAICPGWVLTPLVQKQLDTRAAAQGISNDAAIQQLLSEKEPSVQFTTPEELGELAVFFCSPAGNNVRGVAWNMDGGWVAQ